MGVGPAVAELTNMARGRGGRGSSVELTDKARFYFFASPSPQAMDGSMSMEVSLDERLKIINCKPK